MNENLRIASIFSTGFLMIILLEIMPSGGHGIMIIEMFKIPFLLFTSIIFGTFYAIFYRSFTIKKRRIIFISIIIFMILLNFLLFPYTQKLAYV